MIKSHVMQQEEMKSPKSWLGSSCREAGLGGARAAIHLVRG
jgi:hypothetical protein